MFYKKVNTVCALTFMLVNSYCFGYSEFYRIQQAGTFGTEATKAGISRTILKRSDGRTIPTGVQYRHGTGRSGGPRRQAWAETGYIHRFDSGGARHSNSARRSHNRAASQQNRARFVTTSK